MTNYKNLKIEQTNEVLIVTIDREKALNALNTETFQELYNVFNSHWNDASIKVAILTGAGEKAFVAGADINELANTDAHTGADNSAFGQYVMKTIQNFPKPVIAAVNGYALGGGCELAMCCDIRLASENAKFAQPEVNLGIIPGYGGTQRLPLLVGRGKAMQMILTGEMVDAREAHRIGLVEGVYSSAELMAKALEMARLICTKAPLAIQVAKECVNRGMDTSLTAGCDLERAHFGLMCGTKDKNEGIGAFLEKRKPTFSGN